MTKNPLLNALAAWGYIALVVMVPYYGSDLVGDGESILIPIGMLSLFVLSAAVMGTIFFYHPAQMYLDGQKQEALSLFLKTLLTFALVTALVFAAALLLAWL